MQPAWWVVAAYYVSLACALALGRRARWLWAIPSLAAALIAVGALLPGIGGSFTRFGHTEVLYVTEFIGIILIYLGYRLAVRGAPASPLSTHDLSQQTAPVAPAG